MTWANLMLYNAVLPSFDTDETDAEIESNEVIRADDKQNLHKVRQILFE